MKQKKFLGVSSVSFFLGGGVDFCPHSIILSLETWSNHRPPPLPAWELGAKKELLRLKQLSLHLLTWGSKPNYSQLQWWSDSCALRQPKIRSGFHIMWRIMQISKAIIDLKSDSICKILHIKFNFIQ